MFRQGKMGRFSVESCVRSYSSQTQVTSARIKDFPCWGWLDRTCQTMREPTTPTKTFGRPVLENSYYANVRIATMLIRFRWWLSRAYTSGSTALNDRYWPCFLLVVLLLSALLCSLPQLSHLGQLEKGDPVDQEHSQWGASSKKGS